MLPVKTPALFVNRLLATLPGKDHRQVLANCEPVELHLAEVISEPGERIRHVYFPTDSFVSLVTPPDDHAGLEVGLVGDEGMIGTPLILGVEVTPLRTFVQGAGPAWRMTPERFRDALGPSRALQTTLNRYLHVLMNQLAQMVACTRFHMVEAPRPLVVDDPGSSALGPLPCHPGIPGLHAGGAPRRRHQGGERAATAQTDSL